MLGDFSHFSDYSTNTSTITDILYLFCGQFNMSAGSVGLLMIGVSLPYGAASPIFGIISDKYPVSELVFLALLTDATAAYVVIILKA